MNLNGICPIGPPNWGLLIETNAASGPIFELQTGPTDNLVILAVNGYVLTTNPLATQTCSLGFGVPAVKGTGTLSRTFSKSDTSLTNSLPGCTLFAEWTKPPTIPTTFLRRQIFATNMNLTAKGPTFPIRFVFRKGIRVSPSSSLVLWCISAPTAVTYTDFSIEVDA